jgi:large subunit ribosomal protein L5
MAVPRLRKIVVSMSVKQVIQDKNALKDALQELTLITGQKPAFTKAKKSVASFKLRKGMPLGCKVTLRGVNMYAFLYRLIHIVFPRIRDFRGFSKKSFDLQGNYNIGVKEQIIFPEIDYDKIKFNKGMNITFVVSSVSTENSLFLLRKLGVPVKK